MTLPGIQNARDECENPSSPRPFPSFGFGDSRSSNPVLRSIEPHATRLTTRL
jgi:hypothetical protein